MSQTDNALITGYSSEIAQTIAEALAKNGWRVFGQSRKPSSRAEVFLGKFTDIPPELLNRMKLLVHVAAPTPRSEGELSPAYAQSLEANRLFLGEVGKSSIQTALMLSTSSVYENDPRALWTEEQPLSPSSAYAIAKLKAEEMLTALPQRSVALRCPAVLGWHSAPTWLSAAIEKIRTHQTVKIQNPSALYNRFATVDFLGEAVAQLARATQARGAINLAPKNPIPLRQITESLVKRFNSRSHLEFTGNDSIPVMDTTKLSHFWEGELPSVSQILTTIPTLHR